MAGRGSDRVSVDVTVTVDITVSISGYNIGDNDITVGAMWSTGTEK